MVYTAVPLATVGGIFLLWLRGLPFSISAGVGFIALFGIAVLNGIVLIEHFKELKEEGITDIKQRVIQGASERMRAVLLTASAAALGFFPMAFSNGAGAEVQRPLATVVIGGLVTSTLLTLIVLPILYYLYETSKEKRLKKKKNKTITAVIVLLLALPFASQAQEKQQLSLDEAIAIGLENNSALKAAALQVEGKQSLLGASFNLDKTNVYYNYDENNIGLNGLPIKVWGISQAVRFPTVYAAQRKVANAMYGFQQATYDRQVQQFTEGLSLAYYQIVYLQNKRFIYASLDSLYSGIAHAAQRKYELGDQNYLDMLRAQAEQQNIRMQLKQIDEELKIGYTELNIYLMLEESFEVGDQQLKKLELVPLELEFHPQLRMMNMEKESALSLTRLEKANVLPDFNLEYFQGKNNGANAQLYQGFSVGINLPLWFGANQSRIKSAAIQQKVIDQQYTDTEVRLKAKKSQLLNALSRDQQAIDFYNNQGKEMAKQLLSAAKKSYEHGEISVFEFVQSVQSAQQIEITYLDNLISFNQNSIRLKYLNLK